MTAVVEKSHTKSSLQFNTGHKKKQCIWRKAKTDWGTLFFSKDKDAGRTWRWMKINTGNPGRNPVRGLRETRLATSFTFQLNNEPRHTEEATIEGLAQTLAWEQWSQRQQQIYRWKGQSDSRPKSNVEFVARLKNHCYLSNLTKFQQFKHISIRWP